MTLPLRSRGASKEPRAGARSHTPREGRSYRRGVALLGSATLAVALTTSMAAMPASASSPEGTVLNAASPTAVAGSYIVVLRDAAVAPSAVAQTADSLVARYGGSVARTYSAALRGFELAGDASAARHIAAESSVAYVEQSQMFHTVGVQPSPPSWGLDRIDQRNLPLDASYTYPYTASNVHAYVIDTGIRFSHSDFGGRAATGYDAVDLGTPADDCNGHGTHVSGTVGGSSYGVAKGVQLVGVRVLNCSGQGTSAQVVAGINWVAAHAIKPAVANMSLGGGADSAIDTAVSNAINAGVTFAIAAGNSNRNACSYSPARVAAAITVGATGINDARASYSNYGTCLDLFAPGTNITSDWYTSDTATNTISGTSMATPHTTGAAALVLAANPSYTPQQVRDALVNNATIGVVTNPGTGSPNRLLYVGTGGAPPPGCDPATNGTDLAIPDHGVAVYSNITISGCSGNAGASSTVEVHIVHTYRGDVVIDLVAPDGSTYRLKNSSGSDSADNVDAIYSVNLSSEVANGVWRLKVQDVYTQDTGYLNTWTLDL